MIKYLIKLFFVILALAISLFLWVGYSSSGLNFVLARVPDLTVNNAEGSILGGVSFDKVNYLNETIDVSITKLKFDWQAKALLSKKIIISRIEFTSLDGHSITKESTTTDSSSPIELPLDITIARLMATTITWQHDEQEAITLDRVELSAETDQSTLVINSFEINTERDQVKVSGQLDFSLADDGELKLELSHKLSSTIGLSEAVIGNAEIHGTWSDFSINHTLQAPYKLATKATLANLISGDLKWLVTSELDPSIIEINKNSLISGKLRTEGTKTSNLLQAELLVQSDENSYEVTLDSTFENDQLNLNKLNINKLGDKSIADQVIIKGNISDVNKLINQEDKTGLSNQFLLSGDWRSLNFLSLITDAEILQSSGKFSVGGALNNYKFDIQSETEVPEFSALNATINGSGTLQKVNVDSIAINGEGIEVVAKTIVNVASDSGSVELNELSGKLHDEPILGEVKVRWQNDLVTIEKLDLLLAGTQLKALGSVGQVSNLSWSLNSDDLTMLSQDLSGVINADGNLTGDITEPVIDASLEVQDFVYNDIAVQSIDGVLTLGIKPKSNLKGTINFGNVSIAKQPWISESKLVLSGSLEQHTIDINSLFDNEETSLVSWQGQYINEEFAFTAIITTFPVSALNPFIESQPFQLSGNLNAEFKGGFDQDKVLNTGGSIEIPELIFKPKLSNDANNNNEFVVQQLVINLNTDENVDFNISASLSDGGELKGDLQLADTVISKDITNAPLKGEIELNYNDLSNLAALLPPMMKAAGGALVANAKIGGTINSPEAWLTANLKDGLISIPEQGVTCSEINLTINSISQNSFQTTGECNAGDGLIALKSNIEILSEGQLKADAHIIATDALFMDSHNIKAEGDADLLLVLDNEQLDLTGTIKVDKADIKIDTSLNTISESPDLVLQGLETEANSLLLTMKLNLDIGEQTTISAYGLTGRLAGQPVIRLDENGLLSSVGEVRIVDGFLNIGGEKLTIDKGVASYTGGAIINPKLSVEATKIVDETKVGITISGNAENPEFSLYSDPSLPDQDILALIFFEKESEELSSTDAFKLISIADSLRRGNKDSKVNVITNNIAGFLGVDNVDVSLDSGNDKRQVSVSSKINSKLDIGYAYNFISSLQAIFLRYKINERWSIQSSVDVESGADIKYKIETD